MSVFISIVNLTGEAQRVEGSGSSFCRPQDLDIMADMAKGDRHP